MRDYLEAVVKADYCAHCLDDIGIEANIDVDLTGIIRAVFECFNNAGLKPTVEKCNFGVSQIEFLDMTISLEGVSLQSQKIQNFPNKLRLPKSKKALQCYLGFVNYYRRYIPKLVEKLNPFYKLLKTDTPFNIMSDLKSQGDP